MDASLWTAVVWTADCSATVELARCAGPHDGRVRMPACCTAPEPSPGAEIDLSLATTKVRLYECCLSRGTPFDIYRWVNLADLAALWPRLSLAPAVRAEWGSALHAIGALDPH